MQLSACEVHGQSAGGAPLKAIQDILLLVKPDVIYIPAQIACEPALLSILVTVSHAYITSDVASSEDASIYQWPAASEAGHNQAAEHNANGAVQILPSRLFSFAKVR